MKETQALLQIQCDFAAVKREQAALVAGIITRPTIYKVAAGMWAHIPNLPSEVCSIVDHFLYRYTSAWWEIQNAEWCMVCSHFKRGGFLKYSFIGKDLKEQLYNCESEINCRSQSKLYSSSLFICSDI